MREQGTITTKHNTYLVFLWCFAIFSWPARGSFSFGTFGCFTFSGDFTTFRDFKGDFTGGLPGDRPGDCLVGDLPGDLGNGGLPGDLPGDLE